MGLGQPSEADTPVLTIHTPRLYKVVRRLTDLEDLSIELARTYVMVNNKATVTDLRTTERREI